MISPTKVSVDAATRDILQELSAQLDYEPVWVGMLRSSIENALSESIDAGVVPLRNSLEHLSSTLNVMNRQVSRAIDGLDEHQTTLKDLKDEVLNHKAMIKDAIGLLSELTTSTGDAYNNINSQGAKLASIDQLIHQSYSEFAQSNAETNKNLRLELMLIKDLTDELAKQREELALVRNQVEMLSRPWWKRIFKRSMRTK